MKLKGLFAALVLSLGAALPAHAQTELTWKHKEGDRFYVKEDDVLKAS